MRLKWGLLASVGCIAVMLALTLWGWLATPDDALFPAHWGISGRVDRYAGKAEALLLLPAIALGLTALLALLPAAEPRRQNLMRSAGAYQTVWAAVLGVLLLVHAGIVLAGIGYDIAIPRLLLIALGGLFAALGYALPRVASNYLFGIRTPWTLSSNLAWQRTHRLGGPLFAWLGAAVALSALLLNEYLGFGVLFGGTTVIVVSLVVYSYTVWRSDPERQAGQ